MGSHATDLPRGVEELAPTDPAASAALFVLPRRAWVIAVGGAIGRVRNALIEGRRGGGASERLLNQIDDGPLVLGLLRGATLLRARPRLADGPLAPIVRDLDRVSVSLEPGPEGAVGEVVARFEYGDLPFAERAERCVNEVLAAFTRKLEATAPWLHAVKVSRAERAVLVKGRIPRAWADGLLHVRISTVWGRETRRPLFSAVALAAPSAPLAPATPRRPPPPRRPSSPTPPPTRPAYSRSTRTATSSATRRGGP